MSSLISRRHFLRSSGALVVSFSAAPVLQSLAFAQGPFDTHMSHVDPNQLDSWIAVSADGLVTAYTGKCDLGQGMYTVQTQLVAEELCVALDRVRLIQCDTSMTPDQGTTSGSQSTPTNFNNEGLAQACATARESLLNMASQRLHSPAHQLKVSDGVISSTTGARISYADLLRGKHFNLPVDSAARRRHPADWTILGKPVPSLDLRDLVTGKFEFVHNLQVPGMLHGRVVRPPAIDATVVNLDHNSVARLPGLVKVVVRKNFLGVVAQKQFQAEQAAAQLKVTWSAPENLPPQDDFYNHILKSPSRDVLLVDSGDTKQQLAHSVSQLNATYYHPYQAHASMGASCAVADVQPGKATVWSATQSVYPTRNGVAQLLGLEPDKVRVIFVRGSGCYGLNAADTVSYDAAVLSQAVGKPVRVQLSRQDEMAAGENFGSACVIEQRAGVDARGAITAWECETWSVSLGGRPGYDRPGNVITGALLGYEPAAVTPQAAVQPTGELRNGSNAVPSYAVGCIGGKCGGVGTVRSERVLARTVKSPFFTGPLRSPLRLQNTFAHECFMDEICARVKADPVAYRLRHLAHPRLIAVLKAAARAANWNARPSPKPAQPGSAQLTGRGVACVSYEGDNGYVALVAEVAVDPASGRVQPTGFVIAQDCGPVSNPAGMRNQVEGGLLQGMSRALGEEITWDQNKITSTTWSTYHSLTLGFERPSIECVLINPSEGEAMGAGETAITLVAAALGNAIFDATAARIRQVPFTPARVKAALAART